MLLETHCRGGLPCWVEMHYAPAEPEVGYFQGVWEIENIQIRPGEYAPWIQPSAMDVERWQEEAEEQANEEVT